MKNEPITTLMQASTETLAADDTVATVEATLSRLGLSWAPVVGDAGELLGVVGDADLLRFHRDKRDPGGVCAWQLCTFRPVTVGPGETIGAVARLMLEHRIHHVVVMEGRAIRGVVSSLDFVRICA